MIIAVPQRIQRCNIAVPQNGILDLPIIICINMKNRDNLDNIAVINVTKGRKEVK